MTSLLNTLSSEVVSLTKSGEVNLGELLQETKGFLEELKLMEKSLELAIEKDNVIGHKGAGANKDGLGTRLNDEEGNTEDIGRDKEYNKINSKSIDQNSKSIDQNSKSIDQNSQLDKNDLSKSINNWYKNSINNLKSYNTSINKFSKNILTNPAYSIDLDDAYTYPLNIDSIPLEYMKKTTEINETKAENQQELSKAIILHLLKIGQSDIIKDMIEQMNGDIIIDSRLMEQFKFLREIVHDIIIEHDLTKPLKWFSDKYNENAMKSGSSINLEQVEFKFHMLQFTLLLTTSNPDFSLDNALAAYTYSKDNFPRFFKNYLHELSPLMTLLLFKTSKESDNDTNPDDYAKKHMINLLSEFTDKMKLGFSKSQSNTNTSRFVGDLLDNFENIHDNNHIFQSLSNEFISYYCKDLNLSNDSSLFQSILSGYINLPSFYKYNRIQHKLSRVSIVETTPQLHDTKSSIIAPFTFDLPFQLSDTNRFLFNYHPIFICPVSKEQLIPITADNDTENKSKRPRLDSKSVSPGPLSSRHEYDKSLELFKNSHNPVVVLKYCQHLALKESVWQLSRRGCEVFKCHYCYKKHKFTEVSEAFFIDL